MEQTGRPSFDPRFYAANISHITLDLLREWRSTMGTPSNKRTRDELLQVDHLVRQSRFFQKLDLDQRLAFYKVATRTVVDTGEYLFRQGDIGNEFYVVIVGSVEVVVSYGAEHEGLVKVVSKLPVLTTFGEKALEDDDSQRKAGIRAAELTELLTIDREGYTTVMSEWRQAAVPSRVQFLRETALFYDAKQEVLEQVAMQLGLDWFDLGATIIQRNGRKEVADFYFIRVGEVSAMGVPSIPTAARSARPATGAGAGAGPRTATSGGATTAPGTAAVRRRDEAREQEFSALRKYDFFGAEAILLDGPIPLTFKARTNVEVYVWKRDAVTKTVAAQAELRHRLQRSLELRCRLQYEHPENQHQGDSWLRFRAAVVRSEVNPRLQLSKLPPPPPAELAKLARAVLSADDQLLLASMRRFATDERLRLTKKCLQQGLHIDADGPSLANRVDPVLLASTDGAPELVLAHRHVRDGQTYREELQEERERRYMESLRRSRTTEGGPQHHPLLRSLGRRSATTLSPTLLEGARAGATTLRRSVSSLRLSPRLEQSERRRLPPIPQSPARRAKGVA